MTKSNKLGWKGVLTYLDTVGVESDLDVDRVDDLFDLAEYICPEELRMVFISNYVDNMGKEQYKDLWFFSDSYVIEALNFAREEAPEAQMAILNQNLEAISVESKDYSFTQKVKETSTLHIKIYTLARFECDFLATGQNCRALRKVLDRYLKCNLVRGQSTGGV